MIHGNNIKIGILGGGQLGAMIIQSAIDYGLKISVLDTDADAPAARYTSSFVCGDANSYADVIEFGKDCDIVTIEKEAVNTAALKELRDRGIKVYPSPELISIVQDKQDQKEFLKLHDIPVVPYVPIGKREDLYSHTALLPACLKMRRDGYDGKGVMMLHSEADLEKAFDVPCILEEKVKIKQEISVIVARNADGAIAYYDPVEMVFDSAMNLLDFQICPAAIDADLTSEACSIAAKIATELALVGIMAIEMFVTEDGRLLVNELAPRPHNSGHHTIEACTTSQYEQHIRAITNMPLGSTGLISQSGLINIIESGKTLPLAQIASIPNVHVHYYGKINSKPGRKIGHITIMEPDTDRISTQIKTIKSLLNQ